MLRKNIFVLITGIFSLAFLILAAIKILKANAAVMQVRRLNEAIHRMNANQDPAYIQGDLEEVRKLISDEEARYYQSPRRMFYSFAADSIVRAEERNLRVYETIAAEQSGILTWELMVTGSETGILTYLDGLANMEKYVVFTAVSIQRIEKGARARITMYLPEIPEYDSILPVERMPIYDENSREERKLTASQIAAALFRPLSGKSAPTSSIPPIPPIPSPAPFGRSPAWVEVVGRYRKPSGRLVLALKDTRAGAVYSLEEGRKIDGWSIMEQPDRSVLLSIDEDSYILDME